MATGSLETALDPIRPARPADLSALLDTLEKTVAWMQGQGIDQWDSLYPTPEKFGRDIEAENAFLQIIRGNAAAVIVLDANPDPEYAAVAWKRAGDTAGIVHRLMVRPEFQGLGLAARMMRFAEEEALRRGCQSLRLDAFTENPGALRLYAKLGYEAVGTIRLRKGVFRCFEKGLAAG